MSNQISTTKPLTPAQVDDILRGIRVGRSLKQIEEALGVDAGAFLELTQADEAINLRFKSSLEISGWAIDSQLSELLRVNYEKPESAVKNNALKLLMDHAHKQMDARNPAVFSGKAPVNIAVPIQIVTSLDLGQQKSLEGVYELKAEHISEAKTADLHIESSLVAGNEPGGEAGGGEMDTPGAQEAAEAALSRLFTQENDAARGKSVPKRALKAKREPKVLENKASRPKSGRVRALVREKQGQVERDKATAQP